MAYIALIRLNLEYASAVFAPAVKTQTGCHAMNCDQVHLWNPSDAHSEPLLGARCLPSQTDRGSKHIANLFSRMLAG